MACTAVAAAEATSLRVLASSDRSSMGVWRASSPLARSLLAGRSSDSLRRLPPPLTSTPRTLSSFATAPSGTAVAAASAPKSPTTQLSTSSAHDRPISPLSLMDSWDPFRASTRSLRHMLDFMERFIGDRLPLRLGIPYRQPLWDVVEDEDNYKLREDEDNYKLRVEMPGFGKDEVKVYVDESSTLVIDAQSNKEEEHDRRRDSRYASYHTRIALPKTTEVENLSAQMNHGVLEVTIPKKKVQRQVREVEVQ